MYSLPRVSTIGPRRAFQESSSTNDMISTTSAETLSFRSATYYISKVLLLFVPATSTAIAALDDESNHLGSRSPSDVLSTFFNFSYYLCFSPFKIKQSELGQFYLHKWLPQQIICIAISIASILIRLAEFRESWPQKPHERWNPVSYFRVSNTLSNLIFHLIVWLTLWMYSERIIEIQNFFRKRKTDYCLKRPWSTKAPGLAVTFCMFNAIVGSACFAFGTDIFPFSTWNPEHLYKCLLSRAKYTLFLHNQSTCTANDSYVEIGDMTAIDHITATISGISLYFRRLNGLYEELFILAGAFSFWLSSHIFSERLRKYSDVKTDERNNNWSSVYEKYSHLTELSDLVNNAYGPVYFIFTITSLFYYSINLDNLLVSDDILVRAKFVAYYTGLILTYLLSADICRQVGYMEIWISKHLDERSMSELSHKQLSLILHEIATSRVGMTGCHLFTVTYSMVAQLAGVLITYFIISVQYRNM